MAKATGRPTGRPPVLVVDGKKHCAGCKRDLDTSAFRTNRAAASGLTSACRECLMGREGTPERRKRTRAAAVRYRENHPERYQAQRRRWYGERGGRDKERNSQLKAAYGITVEQYDEMFQAQAGVCAICRQPEAIRRLGVDHCHTTGTIRGLLCMTCNTGIGCLREDPALFQSALTYLSTHRPSE